MTRNARMTILGKKAKGLLRLFLGCALLLTASTTSAVIILPEELLADKTPEAPSLELQEAPALEEQPAKEPIHPAKPSAPKVTVRMRKPESVPTGQIRLRDVADLECEDPNLLADIEAIDLGATPARGQMTYVYPRRVESALRRLGLGHGDFVIEGPNRVAVENQGREVALEEIEEAIQAAFEARRSDLGGAPIEVRLLRRPTPIHLPSGKLDLEVADLDRPGSGIRNVLLKYWVDGNLIDTHAVSVRVTESVPALLAARDLEPGATLTDRDLMEGYFPLPKSSTKADLPSDRATLMGASVKRRIAAGRPISLRDIEWEPLAKRGDEIDLLKNVGDVRVSMRGTLAEDLLFVGQEVKVRLKKNRKDSVGKAISEGLVVLP